MPEQTEDPVEAELSRSTLYRWLVAEGQIMSYAVLAAAGIVFTAILVGHWTARFPVAEIGFACLGAVLAVASVLVLVNQMRFERASEQDGLLPPAEKADLKVRLVFYPSAREKLLRRLRALAKSRVERGDPGEPLSD